MFHILFIHSLVDGHLDCFHIFWLWWIMLLWTFTLKLLCRHMFSFFSSIDLETEPLGHMATLCQTSCTILHSHQQCIMVPISPCPHQHLLSTFFLRATPCVWTDVLLWSWLEFSWWLRSWASFHVLIGHLFLFFEKMTIQSHCSSFNRINFIFEL